MNEMLRCIEERRSVKAYTPEMPKKEDIDTVIKAGLEAASGRNSLVGAYALHQNKQLQSQIKELNAKIAAQQQNNNNRQRSLGSVRSSGVNSQKDSFLEGFND